MVGSKRPAEWMVIDCGMHACETWGGTESSLLTACFTITMFVHGTTTHSDGFLTVSWSCIDHLIHGNGDASSPLTG